MDLGTLSVPILANIDQFKKSIGEAKSESNSLQDGLSKVGGIALGGVGLAIGTVGATIGIAVSKTEEWDEKLGSVKRTLGGSTDEAAGFLLVADRTGTSIDTLTSGIKIMDKGLVDDQGKLGTTGKALKDLGVNIYDANGHLKSNAQLMGDAATAIMKLPPGLERNAAEMKVFGRSGTDLDKVLQETANGGMASYIDQAQQMGLVTDPKTGKDFAESQAKVGEELQGIAVTLGSFLLPVLTQFSGVMSNLLADPAIRTNISAVGAGIATLASNALTYIPLILTNIGNFVNFLTSHQEIIIGILGALGVAATVFGVTTAIAWITALAPALPLIAVLVLIGAGIALLYKTWTTYFDGIREKTQAVIAFVRSILDALAPFFDFAVKQWELIFKTFTDLFHGNFYAFGQDIRSMLNNIFTFFKDTFNNSVNFVKSIDWLQLGKDIIQGLIDGVGAMGGFLIKAVKNLANDALSAIKGFFGISSPSKVFAGIGQNMMLGMAGGINDNSKLVDNSLKNVGTSSIHASIKSSIASNNNNSKIESLLQTLISKQIDEKNLSRSIRDAMLQVT